MSECVLVALFVFINYKQSNNLRTTYPTGCSVFTGEEKKGH